MFTYIWKAESQHVSAQAVMKTLSFFLSPEKLACSTKGTCQGGCLGQLPEPGSVQVMAVESEGGGEVMVCFIPVVTEICLFSATPLS